MRERVGLPVSSSPCLLVLILTVRVADAKQRRNRPYVEPVVGDGWRGVAGFVEFVAGE